MAERKLLPNSVVLALSDDGGTTYDTVVCLTNVSTDATVDEIDADSFCGPDKQPGTFNQTITAEAQHLINPEAGKISGFNLKVKMIAKETLKYKIFTPVPQDGDPIETGDCFITNLGDTYALDEVPSFSITLACKGLPTLTQYEES
jgi:hypothetical protein